VVHTVTEAEARAWLQEQMSDSDRATQRRLQDEDATGVERIIPQRDEMWGPDDFADWSHDDLVWRIVFLQCVLRDLSPVR
jgi:hypothetical protein